jgi:regulator of replication initiation timing
MKPISYFFYLALVLVIACTNKSNEHTHDAGSDQSGNGALYDQVMDIHDEVMPKMEELYNLKKELKQIVAESPNLVADKKAELENTILQLDSASNAMMTWMNEFNPLPDSASQEAARTYLEGEMEKIKNVKTLTLETIDKARALKNQ